MPCRSPPALPPGWLVPAFELAFVPPAQQGAQALEHLHQPGRFAACPLQNGAGQGDVIDVGVGVAKGALHSQEVRQFGIGCVRGSIARHIDALRDRPFEGNRNRDVERGIGQHLGQGNSAGAPGPQRPGFALPLAANPRDRSPRCRAG